ncbi:MAG: hypothetical protein SPM09_01115 [Fibrobacter sp.]|uniref:hypothetical protein n=1 Tax=Fibrobacter sp. TaxID=35828 RepID=UPI002A91956A|nr:hypothetical protein [Fibrobacter sp.]MDY6262984.1 hypothetical protein [Fibrobacter sp.]
MSGSLAFRGISTVPQFDPHDPHIGNAGYSIPSLSLLGATLKSASSAVDFDISKQYLKLTPFFVAVLKVIGISTVVLFSIKPPIADAVGFISITGGTTGTYLKASSPLISLPITILLAII